MTEVIIKWLRVTYKKTVTSIAFLPAGIALLFLLLSFLMIQLDFSTTGKNIKTHLHWLSLKDASTARSIISAITAGIISLTVFSFSMVMILLNQAASQMSNRILDKLIANRFQQFVLGFYIGTIVYAFFLLSTIRDVNSGIYVPAISTYLLIAFTIFDIFLFIYFLHYITQSIKYDNIIQRISADTKKEMQRICVLTAIPAENDFDPAGFEVHAHKSGVYQGFDKEQLLELCRQEDLRISILCPVSTFVIENTPIIIVHGKKDLTTHLVKRISTLINIYNGQEIETSYFYGFRQLMEVAIRALSPGINDPGTAIIGLRAISELLAYRLAHFPPNSFKDSAGSLRIMIQEKSVEQLFEASFLPIWDYGKKDRSVQREMHHVLMQLMPLSDEPSIRALLHITTTAITQNR